MKSRGPSGRLNRRTVLQAAGAASLAGWLGGAGRVAAVPRKRKPVDLHGVPPERLGTWRRQRYEVGVEITAAGGPCASLYATVSTPVDWPEQRVRLDDEDFSSHVQRVTFRELDRRVRQMLILVPQLPAGEVARAVIQLDIERAVIEPPSDLTDYRRPKTLPRDVKTQLGSSPLIEATHRLVRARAKELARGGKDHWELVETIYDWVLEHIKVAELRKAQGVIKTMEAGEGHHEDVTGTFIALCRAAKIPARMVWIPQANYAEFYLESPQGRGEWLPCRVVGGREIGGIRETRPILQKGEGIRVPEKKKRQRFVGEFLKGKGISGGRPKVKFIRRTS